MIISFTKRLLTNQTSQTNTVDYLRFLYVSSSVKTPLSSQVGNVVLIDVFNVFSRVLSIVFSLRSSHCLTSEKKVPSIPPPGTVFLVDGRDLGDPRDVHVTGKHP